MSIFPFTKQLVLGYTLNVCSEQMSATQIRERERERERERDRFLSLVCVLSCNVAEKCGYTL